MIFCSLSVKVRRDIIDCISPPPPPPECIKTHSAQTTHWKVCIKTHSAQTTHWKVCIKTHSAQTTHWKVCIKTHSAQTTHWKVCIKTHSAWNSHDLTLTGSFCILQQLLRCNSTTIALDDEQCVCMFLSQETNWWYISINVNVFIQELKLRIESKNN